jgi:hypothetical protein
VTATAKTPVGSATATGNVSSKPNQVAVSDLKVSTPIGSVKSAPTQVTVSETKAGDVTATINKPLTITVFGVPLVNLGAGQYDIPH